MPPRGTDPTASDANRYGAGPTIRVPTHQMTAELLLGLLQPLGERRQPIR